MSLFGSLFTGVSALSSQSQSIGAISNNIANISTNGYKSNAINFGSLVTTSSSSTSYTPGSVIANRRQAVDLQGTLQQTTSASDLAVAGNGFFVVQRESEGLQETFYTRAGDFRENEEGFLVNSNGFILQAWPIDENGNLPAGQSDISSLESVNVSFVGGFTRATTSATLALNLNANLAQASFPIPAASPSDFSRPIRVFDSLGTAQDLNFEFRRSQAPTANDTGSVNSLELTDNFIAAHTGMADGDNFTVDVNGAGPVTITINTADTVGDILNDLNAIPGLEARLNDVGEILIQASNLSENVVIAEGTQGTPAAEIGFTVGTINAPTAPNIFPAGLASLENAPNTQGWWQLTIRDTNGSTLSEGHINFNGDGSLNALDDIDGEQKVQLTGIDWGNGSDPQDINIFVDRFSQFATGSDTSGGTVLFLDQNGAELGLRTGIEINDDGVVFARFSNGQSSALFQIPLATFTNVNGLEEVSGVAFRETSASGSFNLREAQEGGAGVINSGSLENSNVDLAEEFSKLIITQRAYSAGTQIISTVDEITEELLRL